MKTVNIAPTWEWVMGMALRLIEDGNQAKAEEGFVEEVERLGPDVKLLIAEFRDDEKIRSQVRAQLMAKARRCDRAVAKKEESNG